MFRAAYEKYSRDGLASLIQSGTRLLLSHPAKLHPLAWEIKYRLLSLRHRARWTAVADPFKTVCVSPDRIERYTEEFSKWRSVARIDGGDWDLTAEPIETFPKFRGCVERFVAGEPWEETEAVRHVLDRIEEHGSWDGCTTRQEVLDRYSAIDDLYRSIQQNGFRSWREFEEGDTADKRWFDYVAVHIGRDGELIFATSGWHRLSIAKLLDGVEEIPVWVRARHTEWQRTRETVAAGGPVEDRLRSHPDLQDLLEA